MKLNKAVTFVKVKESDIPDGIPYRVKTFGDESSTIVVDKKAILIENKCLYQDAECYKTSQSLALSQLKKKY